MYPTIFDTEELNALRDLARRFATEKLAPGYQAREAAGGFGADLGREMGSLGLIAPELPEEFGGLGAGAIYSGVIIEEIARGDFNFGYINILATLNGQILAHFANDEIRREWLPRLIAGELMIAIALTEPRGGSDAANLGLRMERAGDHYIINGEKTSISAADQARGAVVFARTGRPEDRAKGITAVFVPMDTPGISTTRFTDLGQHAIGRGSIFFDNVRVPVDNRLGEEGKGFVQVMQGFDFRARSSGCNASAPRGSRSKRPGPISASATPSASRSRPSRASPISSPISIPVSRGRGCSA